MSLQLIVNPDLLSKEHSLMISLSIFLPSLLPLIKLRGWVWYIYDNILLRSSVILIIECTENTSSLNSNNVSLAIWAPFCELWALLMHSSTTYITRDYQTFQPNETARKSTGLKLKRLPNFKQARHVHHLFVLWNSRWQATNICRHYSINGFDGNSRFFFWRKNHNFVIRKIHLIGILRRDVWLGSFFLFSNFLTVHYWIMKVDFSINT